MNNIWKQIEIAKKELLVLKKCTPYIFPEYSYMMDCKARKEQANIEYLLALEVWDKLGT
jgi:hypothetical protein